MRADDYPSEGTIDLNAGPLIFRTNVSSKYRRCDLQTVSIQASAAISETITVEIDRARGAAWDTKLFNFTLSSSQSIELQFNGRKLEAGDEIKISSTAASIGSSEITLSCVVIFGVGK